MEPEQTGKLPLKDYPISSKAMVAFPSLETATLLGHRKRAKKANWLRTNMKLATAASPTKLINGAENLTKKSK